MTPPEVLQATVDGLFYPMERWGRDHWSTLLYVESCAVDGRGQLNGAKMRGRDERYPTRLADGKAQMHSDWDCLDDMRHAGLVRETVATNLNLKDGDGIRRHWAEVETWGLTEYGWLVAGALRRHRAEGSGPFTPPKRPAATTDEVLNAARYVSEAPGRGQQEEQMTDRLPALRQALDHGRREHAIYCRRRADRLAGTDGGDYVPKALARLNAALAGPRPTTQEEYEQMLTMLWVYAVHTWAVSGTPWRHYVAGLLGEGGEL